MFFLLGEPKELDGYMKTEIIWANWKVESQSTPGKNNLFRKARIPA